MSGFGNLPGVSSGCRLIPSSEPPSFKGIQKGCVQVWSILWQRPGFLSEYLSSISLPFFGMVELAAICLECRGPAEQGVCSP